MTMEREFKQGDGWVNLLPDEAIILSYTCSKCHRRSGVLIIGNSQVTPIDCDEERLCNGCQVKSLVQILKDMGCTEPEERLLKMSVDQLLTLAPTLVPRRD